MKDVDTERGNRRHCDRTYGLRGTAADRDLYHLQWGGWRLSASQSSHGRYTLLALQIPVPDMKQHFQSNSRDISYFSQLVARLDRCFSVHDQRLLAHSSVEVELVFSEKTLLTVLPTIQIEDVPPRLLPSSQPQPCGGLSRWLLG